MSFAKIFTGGDHVLGRYHPTSFFSYLKSKRNAYHNHTITKYKVFQQLDNLWLLLYDTKLFPTIRAEYCTHFVARDRLAGQVIKSLRH
jgi:hypothetical protein